MTAHLAHATAARLMEHIALQPGLLPNANVQKRALRLWERSIENDWSDDQLAALLRRLLATPQAASLSRANGRGSAGQCPASTSAKTPAAGERSIHVVADVTSGVSPRASLHWPGEGVV